MRREIQNRLIFQPNPESFCRAIIFSTAILEICCGYSKITTLLAGSPALGKDNNIVENYELACSLATAW
jgi:hypothetical protein